MSLYKIKVIRKGHMRLHSNMGMLQDDGENFWFVLTTESLSLYKDESEKDKEHMVPLDQLNINDIETLVIKRPSFILLSSELDIERQYNLSCGSQAELGWWMNSFCQANLYLEKKRKVKVIINF